MNLEKRLRGVKITEQLAEQLRQAKAPDRALMLDTLEHNVREFRQAERKQHPSPGGRAAGAHDAMAVWIAQAIEHPPAGAAVQCKRGCAHCCRLLVSVLDDEAVLALLAAEDVGLTIDRERLERQAAATTKEEWGRLPYEDRACVFLRGEECGIYEYRPSSCRKYMVVSAPELCNTDQHPGEVVAILASAMAEIITSAALSVWGWRPLAQALRAILEKAKP
jgi:Fe-S-cluster containining protein